MRSGILTVPVGNGGLTGSDWGSDGGTDGGDGTDGDGTTDGDGVCDGDGVFADCLFASAQPPRIKINPRTNIQPMRGVMG